MKKLRLALAVSIIVFTVALLSGFKETEDCRLVVNYGNETAFEMTFSPEKSELFKAVFYYRMDFIKYAEKKYNGNYYECLRNLNPDITDRIDEYEKEVHVALKEPSAIFSNGGFIYDGGCDGRVLNVTKLCKEILSNFSRDISVNADIIRFPRKESMDAIKARTVKLGEFSTDFETSAPNRRHNIALAASRLNNREIKAGETLSFNASVGERTEENGFKEAKVILDGEFVSGVGGGVCQVSTTLFNAWLKAGLGYEQAAAHSLPVSYVKPSLDAMVSSATDLVLANDSECSIYIHARCKGTKLIISVFGKPCGFEIKLRSAVLEILKADYKTENADLDWAEGETERVRKVAVDGLISESYRDYYLNGKLVKTERLRKNTYKPQQGIKIVRKEIGDSEPNLSE